MKPKITVNSIVAGEKPRYSLSVRLGRDKQYGITFDPNLDQKQLDLALDLLIENITKKELGFSKHDLIMKLGDLYNEV